MYDFEQIFGIKNNASPVYTEIFGATRVSIITNSLIRIENQADGKFCDMPTQTVLCRKFNTPEYRLTRNDETIIIETNKVEFTINKGKLVKVKLFDGRIVTDFKSGNLKGTRRTLDMTFGKVSLGDGVISRSGIAVLDDSTTLLLLDDGTVKPRKDVLKRDTNGSDIYYFAYGNDYNRAIRDYYSLTGMTPLIPRFALGNWWSRYKAYKQEEYLSLMKRFKDEKIPITVATVDMDWHYTDVVERFGKEAEKYNRPKNPFTLITGCYLNPGWTGYTWNKELFPDYREFLKELHDNNYKVTLNLHPAEGMRFYEAGYREFAEFMELDPNERKPIEFDITDKKFIEGYFRFLHHNYENDGVDFWWLDWQQEKTTKIDGLDPLWALNHYHSLDLKRDDNKRQLTLSRFAGYGSHRYPLGFSGDTSISWSELKFQPYFTATASNIGYSWWSHDIGGHHFGKRDDELYIRWVQFGVFSPILRLHSSKNEFLSKEPWKFGSEAQRIVTEFLRLRHKLIPYIYTMNHRTSVDGIPLIKPMYYDYPEQEEAYRVKNEYFFGSELIVCPITESCDKKLMQGGADAWLPDGRYTDIFTGRRYTGGSSLRMYRDKDTIPVLAKAGAIIPLSADGFNNDWKNPETLEILAFSGNGSFKLYEDDGETENYKSGQYAETLFEIKEYKGDIIFTINPAEGDCSVIPQERSYIIKFKNIKYADANGFDCGFEDCFYVKVNVVSPCKKVEIKLSNIIEIKNPPKKELLIELVSRLQGRNNLKSLFYSRVLVDDFDGSIFARKAVREAIKEIMYMD